MTATTQPDTAHEHIRINHLMITIIIWLSGYYLKHIIVSLVYQPSVR